MPVLFFAATSFAATLNWTGNGATDKWSEGANWSSGSVPQTGDAVRNNTAIIRDIVLEQSIQLASYTDYSSGGSLTIGDGVNAVNLAISGAGDTIYFSSGTAADPYSIYIKNNGTLSGTITGSLTSIDKQVIHLGGAAGSNVYLKLEEGGTIKLNTPTILSSYTVSRLIVGNAGTSKMDVVGGAVDVGNVTIGSSNGGVGEVNISSGSITAKYMINVANLGGDINIPGSQGTLNITGGAVKSAQLYVGQHGLSSGSTGNSGDSVAKGVLNLSGGTLTATSRTAVGYSGDGELNVSGGTASLGALRVGYAQTHESIKANGVVNITAGKVTTTSAYFGGGTGDDSSNWTSYDKTGTTGVMNLSGGSFDSSGTVYIGYHGEGKVYVSDTGAFTANSISLGYANTGDGLFEIQRQTGSIYRSNGTTLTTIAGGSGKGLVRFNYVGAMDFANVMTGANLRVEHVNAGTTTMSGASTYAGGTLLSAGTIIASNKTAVGAGVLEIKGGTLKSTVNELTVSKIEMTSGKIAFQDNDAKTAKVNNFTMQGGAYEIDILSLSSFDSILSAGGAALLEDGVLSLSGYEGFEGVLYQEGYRYHIFQGFDPIFEHGLSIVGYDTENWVAGIDSEGYLFFVTIPEPSVYAAMFGAMAFAFAAYRRRK